VLSKVIKFPSEEERTRRALLEAMENLKKSHKMLYMHQRQVMSEEQAVLDLGRKYEYLAKDPDPFIISYLLYLSMA
jgi:hypothetical protein